MSLRSSLASRRPTFRSSGRIEVRTIGWISQVIVLLPQKLHSRSTFQRSRGIIVKGWHLLLWNAVAPTHVGPFDLRSSHCAKQASLMGGWSEVANATVQTV